MLAPDTVGGLMFVFGLITFGAVARIFAWPRLKAALLKDALAALLLFSAFRWTALEMMNPAVVPTLNAEWARLAGTGDVAAGLLALIAALVVRVSLRGGVALAWLYGVVGTADFVVAGSQSAAAHANDGIGAAWPIFNFAGPAWIVTLVLLFTTLIKNKNRDASVRAS
jgi:hypothetical protein